MNKTWQQKQKESIQSGYNQAKELAKEIWDDDKDIIVDGVNINETIKALLQDKLFI